MDMDPKYIELINAEIDGEIPPEDRALLDSYLESNQEARGYRDELRETAALLDSVEAVEPPAGLSHAVMANIRPDAVEAPVPDRSIGEILGGFFGVTPVRYALSFAAGVVLTFSLISSDRATRSAFDDVTTLVGTMGDPTITETVIERDVMQLTLNELAGSVSLNSSGSLMILDFDLASRQPVEIVAQFDNRDATRELRNQCGGRNRRGFGAHGWTAALRRVSPQQRRDSGNCGS
jgi:hypothetical protein